MLFASALPLFLFAVSCRQSTVWADNEDLTEMMQETVWTLQHNPDSAIAFLDAIWNGNGEQMTNCEKATFYNLRGAAHAWKNEFETAKAYQSRALQFAEKLNDGDSLRQALIINDIALNRKLLGDLYGALESFQQARTLLENHQNTTEDDTSHLQLEVYRNLLSIHAMRGDMDSFTATMEAKQTLRNALFAEQSNRVLHEMQARYETERKEMLIAQQEDTIERKRATIARIIFAGIVIIALLVQVYFLQRKKMQNLMRIVQQHESIAKYEKENTRLQSKSFERILSGLKQMFEEEKAYRQQGLTQNEVCEALNTNRTSLANVISENYQKTFLEYLNGYRIREAKILLKEQNEGGEYAHYTVQAIGEMVGFGSRSVFYEAFKQIVGVSPSEYKKVSKELQAKELKSKEQQKTD